MGAFWPTSCSLAEPGDNERTTSTHPNAAGGITDMPFTHSKTSELSASWPKSGRIPKTTSDPGPRYCTSRPDCG